MMRRAAGEDGFTLVELLVSLALLGLASLLVAQAFGANQGALRRLEARTTAVETVAAAQDRIRDRIEHLFAQTRYDNSGPFVDLEGTEDRLDFLVLSSAAFSTPIQPHRLALEPGGDLILAASSDGAALDASDPSAGVLLQGVQNLEISYYGATAPGQLPTWRSEWRHQIALPQLVRIRLSFSKNDRRIWPELIVRPAPTVDTDCVVDVATSLCRGRS